MWRARLKNFGIPIATAVACVALFGLIIGYLMVGVFGLSYSDSARLFQAVGAVTVIVVGAVVAYRRLQIFRTFEPHLTISHEISHRPIGESFVHITATSTLLNNSRVNVEILDAYFTVQMVSPMSDDEVRELYSEAFEGDGFKDVQWPLLVRIQRGWQAGELVIEPAESHQETTEFILSAGVETVLIYTYFHNPAHAAGSRSAQGWSATSVHDIV